MIGSDVDLPWDAGNVIALVAWSGTILLILFLLGIWASRHDKRIEGTTERVHRD